MNKATIKKQLEQLGREVLVENTRNCHRLETKGLWCPVTMSDAYDTINSLARRKKTNGTYEIAKLISPIELSEKLYPFYTDVPEEDWDCEKFDEFEEKLNQIDLYVRAKKG